MRYQGKKLTLFKIKGKPFYSAACLFIDAERPQGVWGTPQKCVCGYPNAMLAKHVYPKTMTNKPDGHTNPYIPQGESTIDSLKIFNSSE